MMFWRILAMWLLLCGAAGAATIDSTPLIPGGLIGTDKLPLGREGSTAAYTSSVQQITEYVNGWKDIRSYASLAAAIAEIDDTPATLAYRTNQVLSANLVIPATVELMPLNGAVIDHGTYTVSYSGSTSRFPDAQVFSGSGAVTGLSRAYPDWFATNIVPGTTDMAGAIIKAIIAAPRVEFKPETIYYQSVPVAAPGVSNRTLVGNGATLKSNATNNFSQIYLDNTNSKWEITGFKFLGAANTGAYSVGVYGIDCFQSSNNYIHDNSFDMLHSGIYIRDTAATGAGTNPAGNRINKNRFYTMIEWATGYAGYGILSVKTINTQIKDNTMLGPIGRHGIYLSAGTRKASVTGNTVYSSRAQISLYMATAGDDITDNMVSDNLLFGPGTYNQYFHGIYLSGEVYRNTFANNHVYGSGDCGLYMETNGSNQFPHNNTFAGNDVYNSGSSAIQIIGGYNNSISGGVISGANVGSATANGIVVTNYGAYIGHDNVLTGIKFLAPTNPLNYTVVFDTSTYGNVSTNNHISSGSVLSDTLDLGNNKVIPIVGGVQTIASAASITPDPRAGELVNVTLAQNITVNNPTYKQKGDRVTFNLTQNGTGGYAVSWDSSYKVSWVNTGNTANKTSSVSFICDGTYFIQTGAQTVWH